MHEDFLALWQCGVDIILYNIQFTHSVCTSVCLYSLQHSSFPYTPGPGRRCDGFMLSVLPQSLKQRSNGVRSSAWRDQEMFDCKLSCKQIGTMAYTTPFYRQHSVTLPL